jgi:hypothetical protein
VTAGIASKGGKAEAVMGDLSEHTRRCRRSLTHGTSQGLRCCADRLQLGLHIGTIALRAGLLRAVDGRSR